MNRLKHWINNFSLTKPVLVRWLVLPFLSLLLIVSLAGTWLYCTESGLKWSLEQLQSYIPKQLTLNSPSGSLSSKVNFESVSWQQQNLEVQAKQLTLECSWFSLLSKEVICSKNRIKQLAVSILENKTSSASEKVELTNTLSQPLAEFISPSLFSDLSLPVSIAFESLDIELIEMIDSNTSNNLKQTNQPSQDSSAQPPTTIYDLIINGLELTQYQSVDSIKKFLRLSYSKLQLSSNEHQLTSQLNISSDANWPYELKLAIAGNEVSSSISSSGELFTGSSYSLETQLPIKSAQNGQWNWKKNLVINSITRIEPQELKVIENLPTINSAEIKLLLNWPKTNLDYQSNLDWLHFQGLDLIGKIKAEDILSWKVNSEAQMSIHGEIKQSQWLSLKQAAASLTDDESLSSRKLMAKLEQTKPVDYSATASQKNTKQLMPINLELFANIAHSNLSVTTQKLEVAELNGSLNLTGELIDFSLPNYQLEAELIADKFDFSQQYFAGINAALVLKSLNEQLSIDTNGVVAQFKNESINSSNLKWNLKLANQWLGQVDLGYLTVNELSLRDVNFKLYGNEQEHSIIGSITPIAYQPISFNLKGQLKKDNTNSQRSWNVSRLTAKTELAQSALDDVSSNQQQKNQSFNFEATNLYLAADKQSVERLCLDDFGKACVQASIEKDNWSAQLALQQFRLRPLTRLPILQSLSGLTGELNGKLQATGKSKKLTTLIIDVTSPVLTYTKSQAQLDLTDFAVSNTDPNGTNILSEWKKLTSSYSTPQWKSEISAENGQAKIELNQAGDRNFLVSQESAYWILPYITGEANEQDEVDISKKSLLVNSININGKLTASQLVSDLKIALAADDFIHASNKVSWPITKDSKMDSRIQLGISQLDWLKQWQSRIDQLAGNWTHQLAVTGTPSNPSINGKGEITLSKLEMEELGIDIRDSSITLLSEDYTTNLSGMLKNNQGELKLDGSVTISPELTASLDLNGEKITLIDSNEYKMIVSPKLNATIKRNHIEVTGDVDIDEAKVSISQLPAKTIKVSEDEIIVNNKRIKQVPYTYNIRININAKNNVSVKGFGLSSEVLGKLSANAQTGKTLDINGQLYLENGQFEAYKQVLTIEQGQLLFLGNPENPGIQFKASRKIEESIVGLIASGSLANPTLRLFSQPAMADEEVLALLLTGRSLESLTQQEGNALANAAISLGVSEANKLAAKIADALGIKNINITTKTKAESTRVDIGTQVNDRLTVGFGTNIDSTNQLNSGWIIEYRLSPSISFEAISGEEVSANITYKKQFDDKKLDKDKKKE